MNIPCFSEGVKSMPPTIALDQEQLHLEDKPKCTNDNNK